MKTKQTAKTKQTTAKDVEDGFVSINEAARFLCVSSSTVTLMLRRKELPSCVLAKRSRRIPKAALIRYANARLDDTRS